MKKIIFYSTVVPLCVIGGIVFVAHTKLNQEVDKGFYVTSQKTDLKNFSVYIDGVPFSVRDGKAENLYFEGGERKDMLDIFGEPVQADLEGDGDLDAALILVNNPGGSGTFYYAVLLINQDGVFKATNAILLGDRIAPQTIEIHDGIAVFNIAERKKGEPMSTQPSIGKSVWLDYDKEAGTVREAEGYIDLRESGL